MESFHRQVLFVYAGFAMLATMLALARRWIKPNGNPSDVWKKYPIYVLLNFAFLAAIWLPHTCIMFHVPVRLVSMTAFQPLGLKSRARCSAGRESRETRCR